MLRVNIIRLQSAAGNSCPAWKTNILLDLPPGFDAMLKLILVFVAIEAADGHASKSALTNRFLSSRWNVIYC